MNTGTPRRRAVARRLYKLGWTRGRNTGTALHRIHDLSDCGRFPWYDWGHRLMIGVGQYRHGSWDAPRARDMWFRRQGKHFITTNNYDDVWANPDHEWRIFDSQDDGHTIVIGRWPHPDDRNGNIHRDGLDSKPEQRLFLRWMLWDGLVKAEWFGLRTWLYYRGLHRAVRIRKPFTCQRQCDPKLGGYSHWYCTEPKRHHGPHRVGNYRWTDSGRVEFDEKAVA